MTEWTHMHIPCPHCGSSDAASINSNGWLKCFSCGVNVKAPEGYENHEEVQPSKSKAGLIPFDEYRALSKRKITES